MIYRMTLPTRLMASVLFVTALLILAGCGGGQASQSSDDEAQGHSASGNAAPEATDTRQSSEQKYPDVLEAELESSGGDTWSLAVTISSPYDTQERYADGWRVLTPDGTVLGKRELVHPHGGQSFTRTQSGLEIPQGVEEITIEGRDLKNGYGGDTVTIPVESS